MTETEWVGGWTPQTTYAKGDRLLIRADMLPESWATAEERAGKVLIECEISGTGGEAFDANYWKRARS